MGTPSTRMWRVRSQLRIGSGLCWTVAWMLAVTGPLAYLFWPDDLTWWLAPVPAIPLCLLAEWRHERKGFQTEPYGGPVDGAFTPPADHGGGF